MDKRDKCNIKLKNLLLDYLIECGCDINHVTSDEALKLAKKYLSMIQELIDVCKSRNKF